MSLRDILESEWRTLKLEASPLQEERLLTYANELERWNKSVNLTSLHGVALVRRLIVEPVWVGHHLEMSGVVADVGSGNGSPGIPLAVSRSFSTVYLIEPRMKRAVFLRHIVARLHLREVVVDRRRIENIPEKTALCDWITLQAVDPTPNLLKSLRLVAADTTRVVWITSIEIPPVSTAEKIAIPGSRSKVWMFQLDQI